MKKLRTNSKGFTLIELIIVVVILGVLVGIAVPSYLGYVEQANENRDRAKIDSVYKAFNLAITDPTVTINPGTIYYRKDGTLAGIGVTLTAQFEKLFGPEGKTAGPGQKGYKVEPLLSKKYQNAEPGFNFQWSNKAKGTGYIVLTYLNPQP